MSLRDLLPLLCLTAMILSSRAGQPDFADLPSNPALPDPLLAQDGTRIATAEEWKQKRVPELRELFQHYEYGHFPPAPAKVDAKVEREDDAALGGKANLKEVTLTWGLPESAIHLLLVTPHRPAPAPVFLGLSFTSVHQALKDPHIAIDAEWLRAAKANPKDNVQTGEESRGVTAEKWNIEKSIDRGYAVAIFYNADVVPDQAEVARERLKAFRPAERADAPAPDDCATIAAWAWGLMRAVDYLVTAPGIDPHRIAVVGHSRNGKTAMLAGAFDDRIAMVIPAQAGCGGTAPSRVAPELSTPQANGRSIVETVARINTAFPHWFCDIFKHFNADPARLPVDQHELIALCAPRPVLISAATEDLWANPAGQFQMARAADPVYRLVAGEGIDATQMPEPSHLLPTRLGYFLRPGKHEVVEADWSAWLDYADRWLK